MRLLGKKKKAKLDVAHLNGQQNNHLMLTHLSMIRAKIMKTSKVHFQIARGKHVMQLNDRTRNQNKTAWWPTASSHCPPTIITVLHTFYFFSHALSQQQHEHVRSFEITCSGKAPTKIRFVFSSGEMFPLRRVTSFCCCCCCCCCSSSLLSFRFRELGSIFSRSLRLEIFSMFRNCLAQVV